MKCYRDSLRGLIVVIGLLGMLVASDSGQAELSPQKVTAVLEPPFVETIFRDDGRLSDWTVELMARAAAGKLSELTSVRVENLAGRQFVGIGGYWIQADLTGEAKIVPAGGENRRALLADEALAAFAAGRHVILRGPDSQKVAWLIQPGP
ncbi:MAG: hypothetical protein ACLFUJ_15370 [Phycisphaerae bacterium]